MCSGVLAGIGHSTRINLESLTTGRHIVEDELSGLAQVDTGEDVALYCHAEGSGELQYDWFHNGRKIPKNKTKKLSLHSFSASESGTYTCSAKNGAGHSKSNVPSILTTVKSQLVRFTKDTVATVDSTVRLPCAFQPPANPVEWLFRGSLLGQTSQYEFLKNLNNKIFSFYLISDIVLQAYRWKWWPAGHLQNQPTERRLVSLP